MQDLNQMKNKSIPSILLISACLLLVACGGSETDSQNKTQVAAKVNNEEITVHQLNQVLMTMGNRAANLDQEKVMTSVLDNLITQSILVQEAEKTRLDRDPTVMQAIEAAKRKVLADAFLQRSMNQTSDISDTDIKTYYESRPELFADRKLFRYQQLTLSAEVSNFDSVVEKVKQIETMSEFTDWLSEQAIEYKIVPNAQTSERVPPALLKPLNSLQKNDVGFLKMTDGLLVIELIDVVEQSVSLELASPAIQRHLAGQSRQEQLKQQIAALRSTATIEYMGDFKQESDASEVESVSPEEDAAPEIEVESHIEKGLKGFK